MDIEEWKNEKKKTVFKGKGGIYATSPIVQKKKLKVEVYTLNLRILGNCYLPVNVHKGRLTDLLNEMGCEFIPITDAQIYDRNSNKLVKDKECVVIGEAL